MRLLIVLALAGCDINLFSKPENDATDIPCSSDGHCPPGQTCVQSENVCHRPCTRPGPCMGGNCECNNNNNSGNNDTCDVDLFCRPSCNGGGGNPNMCDSTCRDPSLVCDPLGQICRPRCTNTCAGGFSCVSLGACAVCRPSASPVPDGGMPGPDMAMPANAVFVTHEATNVRFIALDGQGNIFWNNDQGVLFCPINNCTSPQPMGLAHGVNGLAIANGNVVWSDAQGNVNTCPSSGCATPNVLASGQPNVGLVAADSNAAYWMAASPAPQLFRCNFPNCGGMPQPLIGSYGGSLATAIAVALTDVYWVTMANVVRCNSTGCTMPQNVESTIMTPVMGLALAPPNGYFSGGDCIDVCNLGTLSCTPKIACNGGQANIVQSLAADNKDLFWSIGGQLKRCTLPCTNNAIPAGTAQMASVVAMDGNFFYWGDFSAGTISKLPR